ncbi:hypothetical protein INS49_003044 [Diaporthe citri]|uniref:uncharacterized protein n=1 Tax=Diaporthe citri TaxID=83186 RepID=UPI001C820B13|nr:uncharacterized protein INS49_003044 [Diaporthe citri]KAG6368828.1 hypothetical protein INS49_003044 [Diaporthe citri]
MAFLSRLCNPRGDEIDVDSAPVCNVPLLNSTLKPVPDDRTFPLFSSLPKELRLQIWEEATPRERLVHVTICCRLYREKEKESDAPVRYLKKNHLGNPISGSEYQLFAEDGRLDHALLSVNREARQVVLDFYRIHIPAFCVQSHHGKPIPHCYGERTTLHINPEHDVIQFQAQEPVRETLIDFLWDLKAYDPKGVGLLRLATSLENFCTNDLQYLKRSDLLLIRQRQALVETLSQLQEVWFVNVESGRNLYQPTADGSENMVPYGIKMSGYESVGPEAREGAEAELQRVYMGRVDPRELIWRWKRLLRTWKIHHPHGQVKYRLMVAQQQKPFKDEPSARGLARIMGLLSVRDQDRYYYKEDKIFRPGACEAGSGKLPDQVKPEESGTMKTAAVGFWSFPIEAVGDIGKGKSLRDCDYEPNRFLDMRSHWPELLLAKTRTF